MEQQEIDTLFKKYKLTSKDWFKHKHYQIITRPGIDKIQAVEKMLIKFDAVKVEPEFCVVKAMASKGDAKIETFGSAKYGAKEWNKSRNNGNGGWDEHGNCTTWYVMEMAEKRAMSRAVLKLTGFYELGVFGEDESEDFKRAKTPPPKKLGVEIDPAILTSITNAVGQCKTLADLGNIWSNNKEFQSKAFFIKLKNDRKKILTDNGITK